MYDMTRVNANGYFDAEDSADARYEKKRALNARRTTDYRNGEYALAGGVVDPLPDDVPFFVKDYHDYYKTPRGYHSRSLNSNGGWNVTGCMSFLNQPILRYVNEIRSAVLVMHGEKAHSCYFSRDAYAAMVKDNPYTDNKELLIIPDAVHTDLYDGGGKDAIPLRQTGGVLQRTPALNQRRVRKCRVVARMRQHGILDITSGACCRAEMTTRTRGRFSRAVAWSRRLRLRSYALRTVSLRHMPGR